MPVAAPLRLAAALAGGLLALAAAAPADAATERAASGAVSATLSYRKGGDSRWRGLQLRVARAGVPAFAAVARGPGCRVPHCAPAGAAAGGRSLRVLDVDADGEPEVLVDLYTGGAHCCTVTELLHWTGAGYAVTTHDWLDAGYALDDRGRGRVAFVTGDARFAYAFSSYADSRFPVVILEAQQGVWRDVTRAHPETLRAEAARLRGEYDRRRGGPFALGILAAWVADEERLGRGAHANGVVRAELRAGRLRGMPPWPAGRAYVRELRRTLRAWGYTAA